MKPRIPAPSAEYLKFLDPYPPEVIAVALATRKLVLEEAPGATELIYDAYSAVASGFSFTGRPSDGFIHIAVYSKWVNLGFNFGAQLPDPHKVLQGSGRWIRHLRIAAADDLAKPYVRPLVRAAIAEAERPDSGKPAGGSVVRAIYPNRRRPK